MADNIPFQGTQEQEKKLLEVIAQNKDMQGALLPVLHEAQEIYGYLPIEVQQMVSAFRSVRFTALLRSIQDLALLQKASTELVSVLERRAM